MRAVYLLVVICLVVTAFAAGHHIQLTPQAMSKQRAEELSASLDALKLITRDTNHEGNAYDDRVKKVQGIPTAVATVGADGNAANQFTKSEIVSFYAGKAVARSDAAASLYADETQIRLELLQVAQNDRIISLLEKIANQKTRQ